MAIIENTTMTYEKSNNIDVITELYIHAKRNPKELLSKEAQEWRNYVCSPTEVDPFGTSLSFTKAYEKHMLPKLSTFKRDYLRLTLKRISEGKVPVITSAVEEELVFTASDYKLLLERLDQLELEVSMLRSQNAFADVAGK